MGIDNIYLTKVKKLFAKIVLPDSNRRSLSLYKCPSLVFPLYT